MPKKINNYLKNLKLVVRRTLEAFPDTRNDDRLLWVVIVKNHFGASLFQSANLGPCVALENLWELPALDSVKRFRALVQAKGEFLPTDPAVLARRFKFDQAQADFKQALGY